MEFINRPGDGEKVLQKWFSRLVDSHEICPYCRKTKKDYIDPETGVLIPLDCECEKVVKNLEHYRDGVLQAQYNVRQKVNFNDSKLSSEDKGYLIETDKNLEEKIKPTLKKYAALKLISPDQMIEGR